MSEAIKKCNKCGETKEISLFGKDYHTLDGLSRKCKKCNYRGYVVVVKPESIGKSYAEMLKERELHPIRKEDYIRK